MTATTPALITWKDSYNIRIPRVDAEHKVLVDLINQLHAAMLSGKAQQTMSKILSELLRYTENHFTYEEGLLAQRRYSALAAHKQQHAGFTKQVRDLDTAYKAGQISISIDTLQFLKNWLTSHILSSDQAYARELGV
jgi:hemerythrin